MKIKLAILEKDTSYLNRIVSVFNTRYSDNFVIYSFTDESVALETLVNEKIDVLVADDAFEIDTSKLPKKCGFAYLCDMPGIESVRDQVAICKFQKADLIYRQIMSVYSDKAESVAGFSLDGNAKVIIFSSPCGGTGTSTMAASCASYFAKQGKKTIYLDIEKFGTSEIFFDAEGQFGFSDIIFAIKSRKSNLPLKLESSVNRSTNGVYFYGKAKIALDMMELSSEDIIQLLSQLKLSGSYDYIIVDMDFDLERDTLTIFRQAVGIVWVSDGSEAANSKTERAFTALSVTEQNADSPLNGRVSLIYNKFSNKTSGMISGVEIKSIGGVPRYEHATARQVMSQVASMDMFEKLV